MDDAFQEIVRSWFERDMSAEDFENLKLLLKSDPAAFETFVDEARFQFLLRDVLRGEAKLLESGEDSPIPSLLLLPIESDSSFRLPGGLFRLSVAASTLLLGIFLVVCLLTDREQFDDVTRNQGKPRVTSTLNAKWENR